VERVVHLSITNASEDSPLPYFRGKGLVEKAIIQSRLSHAILRPTVIFGREDILINNMAWLLRRYPVFAIPGSGEYQLQPVFVEDLAEMAVHVGQKQENILLDAVGPETYTFDRLVRLLAELLRSRARVLHVRPGVALVLARVVGYLVNDVVLTHDEITGLMANLLVSAGLPTAPTRLSDWLRLHADTVGAQYASELGRHYR
jgi:NADH dehydrogenase